MEHLIVPGAWAQSGPGICRLAADPASTGVDLQIEDLRAKGGPRLGALYDRWGNLLDEGVLGCPSYRRLIGPEGRAVYLDRVELDGRFAGEIPSGPIEAGVDYQPGGGGPGPWADAGPEGPEGGASYPSTAVVPCFASGSSVMTNDGMVPVDWLRPGDRLMTRDRGFQPVLWVGRFAPDPPLTPPLPPALAPIEIAPGALGPGLPSETLRVSAQHRLLLHAPQLALCFGHEVMFCRAGDLVGWPGIRAHPQAEPVVYYHLLLPRHEVVLANGLWSESLFLGDLSDGIVGAEQIAALARRAEVAQGGHDRTAYPCLKRWEIALLTAPQAAADASPSEALDSAPRGARA